MEYLFIYEKGPTSLGADVPDLPGCAAAGETQEEVRELVEGAIDLHLRGMRETVSRSLNLRPSRLASWIPRSVLAE